MSKKIKSVSISFLGNATHDSRLTNLKDSLEGDDVKVNIISFDWMTPNFNSITGDVCVYKLNRKNSLVFYLHFAVKLCWELMSRNKADVYYAEDIYTLPFVTIFAKLKRGKVFYNSRELYAFLGGLRNRKYLQKIVTAIERFFIKKVDLVLTTGFMDSEFLEKFYGIDNTWVIRNIPLLQKPFADIDLKTELNIPANKTILLYVGILIDGRGMPQILNSLIQLKDCVLVVLGSGENKEKYLEMVSRLGIEEQVYFMGTKPQRELINYTSAADIGLALIENISISYYHALPNKLFEYIMASLPVLSCNLPQMKDIVESYKVGEIIDLEKPESIVEKLNEWLADPNRTQVYKENCIKAALELNWQEEYNRARNKILFVDN